MRHAALALLLTLGPLACAVLAEKNLVGEKAPDVTCPQWVNTDQHPSLTGLKGRPVLVVLWGMECQVCMCRDVLRKCESLYGKYRKRGLEILGLHLHHTGRWKTDMYALKNNLTFPIGEGGYHMGYGVKQVPRLFLVDKEGVVIWQGDDLGGDFTRKLTGELRGVDFMGETKLPKSLSRVKQLLVQRKFGKAIEKMIDFAADVEKPEEERKAVRAFKEKLENQGDSLYLRATSLVRTGDPARGLALLERLTIEYKGHPHGRKAVKRLDDFRKDPELKAPLKAADLYRQMRQAVRAGNPRSFAARARLLLTRHSKTKYARWAEKLVEVYDQVE
jgi:hypothetical protein